MGLELLAISLGLSTFDQLLRGRRLTVHSDNSGSEVLLNVCVCTGSLPSGSFPASQVALRRGTARSLDHAQLVHEQWFHAALSGMDIFVKRVATDDNIADMPSRLVQKAGSSIHNLFYPLHVRISLQCT